MGAKLQRLREAEGERRRLARLELERKARVSFKQTHHGLPTLFSKRELARLNAERSQDDQLEAVDNSLLLRHHCSFPDCVL